MARDTWYRLDNVGKFYSSQAGSSAQTVFRYAATMRDDVDPATLQRALERTAAVFPNFNVCLRSGMFWHYLEQAAEPPAVHRENLPLCYGLHVHAKSVLFRVSYHAARINLEVSHIVSDGRGSLSFFKALLHAYIEERYGVEGVPPEYDGSDHQKAENSFDKYFERDKAAPTRAPKVYRLSGWRDKADPTFFEYHLPAGRVLDLAHDCGVSLTALLIAVIMCSIRAEMPRRERQRAIRMDVPVDLRRFFKSTTVKNFFGLAFVSYIPGDEDEPVEVVARQIHDQLRAATQADELKSRMNRMIKLEKNPLLRLAPLFVKDAILELADRVAARDVTTTMSNLGTIRIDERLAPYLRDVNILTSTTGMNFMACSFGDDLSIGISTVYSNPDIIKNFCRFFSGRGIEGTLNLNKTSEEVAEDRIETKIEASMKRLGGQDPARGEATDAREDDGR
ncbi:phthiocerol/phthiodiolone dimycocerosyl transferase family protein [Eggerthella guodeyinii]|uniref:Phthiocerol/phthiodiolone dimycocerosyl transferase n=1 Tax=Eggerthella guodeyinii TaxID=2690837 RepID=A0A6N7RQ83_9ACTN|nr:alcohol acetyltransferase [Eggerthella guodeyinii]MRX82838.1 alcohol acetyltransferase [Eggerthella guodeyinii]